MSMKNRLFSLLLGLFLTFTVHAHGEQGHAARHGGQLMDTADYLLEWVAKDNALYITDHQNQDIPTTGASGRIIAVSGGNKTTINLSPAGGNRLNLSEPLPSGTEVKAVISITLPGRAPVQARIEGVK